jgi:hypothetical protein
MAELQMLAPASPDEVAGCVVPQVPTRPLARDASHSAECRADIGQHVLILESISVDRHPQDTCITRAGVPVVQEHHQNLQTGQLAGSGEGIIVEIPMVGS